MKIIISHDVDHITFCEHKCDLMVPKFIVRSFIELILRRISISEIGNRFKDILNNKWHNTEEIVQFDKENKVHSTFFIGVNNGVGLSYSLKNAEAWIKAILNEGFDVGVHGICFEDYDNIRNEYEIFKSLSGLEKFGMQMHYLRNSANTVNFLNEAGYMFDSTLYKLENPFKVGSLWEFPLHIMDVYLFNKNNGWQSQTLEQAMEATKRQIQQACDNGIEYFTILFHDIFFSNSFKSWEDWYIWVINYLRNNGFEFINYREAIRQLEEKP